MVKIGRPLRYETPDELLDVLNRYFEETPDHEITVTGVALAVGGKQLLQDYESRAGYGEYIKQAKLYVENSYERSLRKNGRSGDIFGLKNFGWRDQQQHEHTGNLTLGLLNEIQGERDQIVGTEDSSD